MKITGKGRRVMLVANGARCGITIAAGNWIEGINPALIKLRAKRGVFPAAIRAAFTVENNSDMREDYFEADAIRLLPGDPLYDQAARAAQ